MRGPPAQVHRASPRGAPAMGCCMARHCYHIFHVACYHLLRGALARMPGARATSHALSTTKMVTPGCVASLHSSPCARRARMDRQYFSIHLRGPAA